MLIIKHINFLYHLKKEKSGHQSSGKLSLPGQKGETHKQHVFSKGE